MVIAKVVTQKAMLETIPASVMTTYGVLRNRDSSRIGKRTRRSTATKTTSSSAPAANVPSVAADVQPQVLPRSTAKVSAATPSATAATPFTSIVRGTLGSRDSSSEIRPSTTAASASGALKIRTQRQLISLRAPPTN